MTFNLIALIMILGILPNYTIPLDSFKEQFAGIDSLSLRQVEASGPMGQSGKYLANKIERIECIDKKGNSALLINSPSIEMRITYKKDQKRKRTVLYFDTVYMQDSIVVGSRSRFIPSMQSAIPLKDIQKVEVQDGKKGFYYLK